jgi:putative hydrolase of the HAD superfamily
MDKLRALELIRAGTVPLRPLPVELPPGWEEIAASPDIGSLGSLKAVLFDLYGTLFVSAAGDISVGGDTELPGMDGADGALRSMGEFFREAVRRRHGQSDKEYPEVRVEEIWKEYTGPFPPAWENGEGPPDPGETALRYELAVNPVYPMPFALEAIRALRNGKILLGIISNAQFFSPLLFDALLGASPGELGFNPELVIFSFEEGEAKPSPALFEKAAARLAAGGIGPRETLYVGNDMLKDIVPAEKAGFRTALFAGDLRSLRLRETECAGHRPDYVFRDLQILSLRR